MGSAAFDTLKAAKQFGKAGFSREQAESLAGAIGESINDRLATKDDLKELEERLTAKIDTSVTALNAKIGSVDQKIDLVKETLETKIDKQAAELRTEIADLRTGIANVHTEVANGVAEIAKGQATQLRWMVGSMFVLVGIIVTVLLGQ